MKVLGISAYYHDSAAALVEDGSVLFAAQEERFTRRKHDPAFPANAIRFCLAEAGIRIQDLDAIVFYDKPLLKFERLLETYYAFSPKGFRSFTASMPLWIREKLGLKKMIHQELDLIDRDRKCRPKLIFSEHHLSHAASAYYPSPFQDAAVLTVDGVGEWATASIYHGEGQKLTSLRELRFPHSVGLLYSAFTYFLGFKVNSGEYKLMGLAPYGDPNSERTRKYQESIRKIVEIFPDGSIWLDQEYFDYSTGLRMVNEAKWERLFGLPRRAPESELNQAQADLALAIQKVTEEIVLKMALEAQRLTGSRNLCLAGGVALNCVANGKLLESGHFESIWIQPAAGDAGGALGAALAACHLYGKVDRKAPQGRELDRMHGSYLGPEYSDLDVERMARKFKAPFTRYENFGDLTDRTAKVLASGSVVGWFQGRSEWGPRSLGNRSILGDPRNPEMQKKLNLKIKYRESFRPFAPSVLREEVKSYFELNADSPYMLLVAPVSTQRRAVLPENYHSLELREKLYTPRSDLQSITHLDFSARIQTVHETTNRKYWELLSSFKRMTGVPVLVNTSFNVRGEPIVLTPEDAYRCFMRTEMDYLIVGNYLFDKHAQPAWNEKEVWQDLYQLD